ncbi:5-methyltetrahydropteroyltriglutamate--homocysteine methyltransferase [Helianthus annuus]|nr:5-methyltetrahydropteroyltriglutamate--homocysteine methyltransferase [Helianthus annuus]
MGPKRELKFALESFWDGKITAEDLQKVAADLRSSIWKQMSDAGIKYISSNTFSYYDQVLDTTAMLGAVPARYNWNNGEIGFDTYFSMARGNASVPAMEMAKWFDTNSGYTFDLVRGEKTLGLIKSSFRSGKYLFAGFFFFLSCFFTDLL